MTVNKEAATFHTWYSDGACEYSFKHLKDDQFDFEILSLCCLPVSLDSRRLAYVKWEALERACYWP